MSQTGWGKPKYGNPEFKKTGKPKKGPGDNYIRILPPMFSLAASGKWYMYLATHWGYSGVSLKDKERGVVRPFRCIEESNRSTRMVTKVCPECEFWRSKVAERDAEQAKLKAAGKSDEEIKTILKSRNDWLKAHGPDRRVYVNVKYLDGTFGDFKMNYKIHYKGIDAKIKEVAEKYKFDALLPEGGVWFNLKRIGNGWDPPDQVELKYELRPDGSEILQRAPLSQEDWEAASTQCRDLTTLGGAILSFQQIQQLVASGGDPETVDRIFGTRPDSSSAGAAPTDGPDDDEPSPELPPSSPPVSVSLKIDDQAANKVADAQQSIVSEVEAARARYEAIKARMAAEDAAKKAAAEEAACKAAATVPSIVNIQNDQDFLRAFDEQQKQKVA
jgi:hypothetical protein